MLVLFLLVALVFMVLIPYVARQRHLARRAQCELRQIRVAQAVLHFEADHRYFPGYKNAHAAGADGESAAAGWVFPVLPYLTAVPAGVDYTRETLRYKEGLLSDDSKAAGKPYAGVYESHESGTEGNSPPSAYIPELVCPDNSPKDAVASWNWNSYVVNTGLPDAGSPGEFPPDWPANGVFMDRYSAAGLQVPAISIDSLKDGADHTFLLTENVDCGAWTDSDEPQVGFVWVAELVEGEPSRGNRLLGINQQTGKGDGSMRFARPSCYHSGGVNVAFCSGRTMFFNQRYDYLVFARLMMSDPAGIQIPGSDQPIDPPYRDVTTPEEPRETAPPSSQ